MSFSGLWEQTNGNWNILQSLLYAQRATISLAIFSPCARCSVLKYRLNLHHSASLEVVNGIHGQTQTHTTNWILRTGTVIILFNNFFQINWFRYQYRSCFVINRVQALGIRFWFSVSQSVIVEESKYWLLENILVSWNWFLEIWINHVQVHAYLLSCRYQ